MPRLVLPNTLLEAAGIFLLWTTAHWQYYEYNESFPFLWFHSTRTIVIYHREHKNHQFEICSGERKEFYWAKEHTNLNKLNFNGLEEAVKLLQGKPVYFTIDLDVLDSSEFCGTGTPEAGGVSFTELLNAIIEVGKLNIVGFDMVELSPIYDQSGASTAIACKILRELLLSIQ